MSTFGFKTFPGGVCACARARVCVLAHLCTRTSLLVCAKDKGGTRPDPFGLPQPGTDLPRDRKPFKSSRIRLQSGPGEGYAHADAPTCAPATERLNVVDFSGESLGTSPMPRPSPAEAPRGRPLTGGGSYYQPESSLAPSGVRGRGQTGPPRGQREPSLPGHFRTPRHVAPAACGELAGCPAPLAGVREPAESGACRGDMCRGDMAAPGDAARSTPRVCFSRRMPGVVCSRRNANYSSRP